MRRLYLQVYFTIVASLVLVVITAGLLWHFSTSFPPFGQQFEVAGEIIAELVPPVEASPQAQQEAIERLAQTAGVHLRYEGDSLAERRAALVEKLHADSPASEVILAGH